ncbi:MAG: response regulator transcription factor [Acidimicrobiales bacterium]|jgi:DNA-binding NarL/FixJ family response regulator
MTSVQLSVTQEPITVVLVTDSFLIGDGLTALLDAVSEVEVVGRAKDLNELTSLVDELVPQAVIISVRSQVVTTMATVAVARRLRVAYPAMGIVVISDRANGFALELLRGGSSGIAFLLDERLPGIGAVLGALRELQMGQSVLDPSIVDSLIRRGNDVGIDDLTPREVDVLEQMAHGLSNRAIADELHISVKSIEKGITAIFLKLGPFDQGASDRRVSAALVFLRAQTDPFGPNVDVEAPATPIVVLKDAAELTAHAQSVVDDSVG